MSRINIINNEEANDEQLQLLKAIEKDMEGVPDLLRVLANSPVALRAYLGLVGIADNSDIDPRTRERIGLAIAQQNDSEYSISTHSTAGRKAGLTQVEMNINRRGTSQNQKAAAAVQFARSLAKNMGNVADEELVEFKKAGYSEAELVEIITLVGLYNLNNLVSNAGKI